MTYRIAGLSPAPFQHLFGMSDDALALEGVKRYVVDAKPGFPDRVEVRDMEPGETALLLNYTHQPADTPYRASHAIFVNESAKSAADLMGEVPEVLRIRLISLRAFNEVGEMVDADLVDGGELEPLILRFLAKPEVAYLHAHYAKRGCYAARIDRA